MVWESKLEGPGGKRWPQGLFGKEEDARNLNVPCGGDDFSD
jgi:hypothetical protein